MVVEQVNLFLATLLAGSHMVLVISALYLLLAPKKQRQEFLAIIQQHGLVLALIISLSALAGSIFYSTIAGFEPCSLCWWQRVFLVPLAVLLVRAAFTKDKSILQQGVWLSIPGLVIALYHSYIESGGTQFISCGVSAVSCVKRYVFEFGYISIPVMSATTFLLLSVIFWIARKKNS